MLRNRTTQAIHKKSRLRRLILCTMTVFSLYTTISLAEGGSGEKTIASFTELNDDYAHYDNKPSLKEATAAMPKEIKARTANGTVTIPLTWECTEDYEGTNESYYLFYASWDESLYPLSSDYNPEGYEPFYEIEIGKRPSDAVGLTGSISKLSGQTSNLSEGGTDSTKASLSQGVSNIIARARHQLNLEWTPLKNINAYKDSSGHFYGIHFKGVTYLGLPYGQQVQEGRYVPHKASLDTFLNAVNTSGSLIYTSRGKYNSRDSVYYANDCSAFVSSCYGLSRMTTTTIAKSSQFTKVSGNSVYNAQVGDCFNKSGSHVELISGLYYTDGVLTGIEVVEQNPPQMRTVVYTPEDLQQLIKKYGYTLLRFNGRNSVEEPEHYAGCYDMNSVETSGEVTISRGDAIVKSNSQKNEAADGSSGDSDSDFSDEGGDSGTGSGGGSGSGDGSGSGTGSGAGSGNGDGSGSGTGSGAGSENGDGSGSGTGSGAGSENGDGGNSGTGSGSEAPRTWLEEGYTVVITWPAYYDLDHYELKLWKGTCQNGQPDYMTTDLIDPECEIELPAGRYEGYIDAITVEAFTVNRRYVSFIVSETDSPDPCRDGHSYNSGSTTTKASCVSYGVKTYKCSVCGVTKKEQLAINNSHSYNSGTVTKEATCAATGTRKYTCTLCGATKTETIAKLTTHTYDSGTVTKAATCTTTGTKLYTCTVCGATRTTTLAANSNHSYDSGKITKAATYTTTGIKTYTCTRCGATKTETIAVKEFKITAQPAAATVGAGNKASFTVKVSGYNISYQWQYKKSGSSDWTSSGSASGKTATYVYSAAVGYASNGCQFRCIIKSEGQTLTSDTVTLTVNKFELSSVANSTKGVTLKWQAASGASGYEIYRKTGSGSYTKLTAITDPAKTTYTDTTAVNGKSYTYKIRYYVGSSYASFSTAVTKKFLAAPTPTVSLSSGKIKVSWTANTAAAGYYVYRKTDSTAYKKIATISSAGTVSYIDSTAVAGTKYTYTVRAYSGEEMSGYYSGVSITR